MNKLVRIEQHGGCLCWVTNTPIQSNYVQTFRLNDISGLTFYKKKDEGQCIVTITMKKGDDFENLQIDEKDCNVLHEAVFGFGIPAIDVLIPETKVDVQKDTVQENITETKTDVPENFIDVAVEVFETVKRLQEVGYLVSTSFGDDKYGRKALCSDSFEDIKSIIAQNKEIWVDIYGSCYSVYPENTIPESVLFQ